MADVTVVIPFFNSSVSLARALASVEWQTRTPTEVIVVDDGSTPRESQAASEIVAGIPRARMMVLPTNAGAGEARNVGWRCASAHWVAFLDSDDAWHPRKLELQLQYADAMADAPAIVACEATQVANLEELSQVGVPSSVSGRCIGLRALLIRNQLPTSSVMVRQNLPLRFPTARYAEDWGCWLEAAAMGMSIVRLDCVASAFFKELYGESGLSANVARMIRGEYAALWGLHRSGAIGGPTYVLSGLVLTLRVAGRLIFLTRRRLVGR